MSPPTIDFGWWGHKPIKKGYKPFDAATLAVYMHGLAADITLQNQSMESMLISDVIENMGKAFKQVMK